MTQHQWQAIEQTLAGLSVRDKREVVDHILRSIRDERPSDEGARRQREALDRLCQSVDAMPAAGREDDLTNRDHDRILYSR